MDDRVQLLAQTLGDDVGNLALKLVPVLCPLPDALLEILLRPVDGRGVGAVRKRAHLLDHVGDEIGVGDHNLIGLLRRQVGKFVQHLLGGVEVKRGLVVRILKALPCHQNGAEDGIVLVHKVDVAGRHHRDAELVAQLDDRLVEILQLGGRLDGAIFHHEGVVADRLHLQIVVEAGDAGKLLPALARHNGAKQLACLAGAADQQPFPVLDQLALGDERVLFKVFEVGHRHQLVEVFEPHLVFDQQDQVMGFELPRVRADQRGVDLLDAVDVVSLPHILHHAEEDFGQRLGIVAGAVVVELAHLQVFGHRVQLVVLQLLIQRPGDGDRVDVGVAERLLLPRIGRAHKRAVKVCVVRHQHGVRRAELLPELERLGLIGGVLDHRVGDAGQLGDLLRDVAAGVDKGIEHIDNLPAPHLHRTDLGDAVAARRQAGGLQVKYDKLPVKALAFLALDRSDHVVDKVGLQAIDHAEVLPALACVHRVREALHHAVVGDGHGAVAPAVGQLCQVRRAVHAVHGGHVGVQVQLHPLDRSVVGLEQFLHQHHRQRPDGDIVLILVVGGVAAHHQGVALLELLDGLLLAGGLDNFQRVGAGVVGDVNRVDLPLAVLGGDRLLANDVSPDGGKPRLGGDLFERDRFFLDRLAQNQHAAVRHKGQVLAVKQQPARLGGFVSRFAARFSPRGRGLWRVAGALQRSLHLRGKRWLADDLLVGRVALLQREHPVKLDVHRHAVPLRDGAADGLVAAALLNQVVAAVLQADGQPVPFQLLLAALEDAVGRVAPLAQLVQDVLHRLAAEQLRPVTGHDLEQGQVCRLHDLLFYTVNFLLGDALLRTQLDGDLPPLPLGVDVLNRRPQQFPRHISLQKRAKDVLKTIHPLLSFPNAPLPKSMQRRRKADPRCKTRVSLQSV